MVSFSPNPAPEEAPTPLTHWLRRLGGSLVSLDSMEKIQICTFPRSTSPPPPTIGTDVSAKIQTKYFRLLSIRLKLYV